MGHHRGRNSDGSSEGKKMDCIEKAPMGYLWNAEIYQPRACCDIRALPMCSDRDAKRL